MEFNALSMTTRQSPSTGKLYPPNHSCVAARCRCASKTLEFSLAGFSVLPPPMPGPDLTGGAHSPAGPPPKMGLARVAHYQPRRGRGMSSGQGTLGNPKPSERDSLPESVRSLHIERTLVDQPLRKTIPDEATPVSPLDCRSTAAARSRPWNFLWRLSLFFLPGSDPDFTRGAHSPAGPPPKMGLARSSS